MLLILVNAIKTLKKGCEKEQRIGTTKAINKTKLQPNYIHITMKEAH